MAQQNTSPSKLRSERHSPVPQSPFPRSQTPLPGMSKRTALKSSMSSPQPPRAQSAMGNHSSQRPTTSSSSSHLNPRGDFNNNHRALGKVSASSSSSSSNSISNSGSSGSLRRNTFIKLPGSANVKVVVRVRPFLPREIDKQAPNLISMDPVTNSTTIIPPPPLSPSSSSQTNSRTALRRNYESKTFTFDHSFYSVDPESRTFAGQEIIYDKVGREFLDHNLEGYHTCIFAYGQTGSGKSYTMMGDKVNPGLIPRTCRDLFERIDEMTSANMQCTIRVSYFEVYNEQVRDLLVPPAKDGTHARLRVRESPTEGPYVEDLSEYSVQSQSEVLKYLDMGNKNRAVASTKMNDVSSRSHAVFTLVVKQVITDPVTDATEEKTARIRLVDLAGSERAIATGATGQRLREGSNINKSLTTLGRVIASLAADSAKGDTQGGGHDTVVPYRDSVLTWILKDSLGGNSKTAMVACISPTDYEETLSTLRYADQAKSIRTRAVVNHDIVSAADRDKLLAEMQERINSLQLSLLQSETAAAANSQKQTEGERKKVEFDKVKGVIRFYEDKAITEETKRRAIQTENEAVKRHNRLLIEHLKEVTNKTVGSKFMFTDDLSDDDEENVIPLSVTTEKKKEISEEGSVAENREEEEKGSDKLEAIGEKSRNSYSFIRHQATYEELEMEMNDLLGDLCIFKSNLKNDISTFKADMNSSMLPVQELLTV